MTKQAYTGKKIKSMFNTHQGINNRKRLLTFNNLHQTREIQLEDIKEDSYYLLQIFSTGWEIEEVELRD
jgi:hypothetical protein